MTHFFFKLPQSIVTEVLVEWLSVRDVGRCDSSCCNWEQRNQFLHIISSEYFFLHTMIHTADMSTYLAWYVKRKVKSLEFSLMGQMNTSVVTEFFAAFDGSHVQSINLVNLVMDFSVVLALIASHCNKIRRFHNETVDYFADCETLLRISSATITEVSISKVQSGETTGAIILPVLSSLALEEVRSAEVSCALLLSSDTLTTLSLTQTYVTDALLHALSSRVQHLRRLTIVKCDLITDHGLATFSTGCMALEHLMLSKHNLITNLSLEAFAANCPRLSIVGLVGSFTEASLVSLATLCGERLRRLFVQGMVWADMSGVDALTAHCTALELVNFAQVKVNYSVVTVTALGRFVRAQRAIKHLFLGNLFLDESVLSGIALKGNSLISLGLVRVKNDFDPDALALIAKQCQALRLVVFYSSDPLMTDTVRLFWCLLRPQLVFKHYSHDIGLL